MTTQKKKKSAKEKRVLIGSVVVATAIVAGSTFAWFSSKDEVTNRLTASADYNVSIVEDFQPPKDWIPGQTVNKDVSAVNTGNVDAFVRMWLGGKMSLLTETSTGTNAVDTSAIPNSFTAVTDESKKELGLNYYREVTGKKQYFKTLSTAKIDNDKDANHATTADEDTNIPAAFSEVQSMQAAGVLVYAPANAKYTWELEQATDLWKYDSNNPGNAVLTSYAKDTKVGSVGSSADAANQVVSTANPSTASGADLNYYGAIDASTFKPETTGLYLFRRNIGEEAVGTGNKYEYSGYYFVKSDENGLTADTYFALYTADGDNQHSDYVLPEDVIDDHNTAAPTADQVLPVTIKNGKKVYLYTATEELLADNALTWEYTAPSGDNPAYFTVTATGSDNKTISIRIDLANINASKEAWTAIDKGTGTADNTTTFYYNNDLEAGDTTTKLVDKVTLSADTQLGAYLAFDFDLNVFLDSVQVTMDEEGNEGAVTVENGWGTDVSNLTGNNDALAHPIIAAKGAATVTNGEIASIAWTRQ